jgi:peroxiredoxin Q/BCP
VSDRLPTTRQTRGKERAPSATQAERKHRVRRRAGYWIIGILAAALVGYAVLSEPGSETTPSPTEMAGHGASSATAGAGPAVGAQAPAFAVRDVVSGRQITAADLRGRQTLLFFSEGVNCQACLVQAADLQKDDTLKKAGIQLVSVTTDPAKELAQAARQYGIRTPMLADATAAMSSAYGMLGHGGMQHPDRDGHAFMLVDEDGRIAWHQAYQEMYVPPDRLLDDMMGAGS